MDSKVLNKMNYYLLNKKESICIEDTADDILSKKVNPNIVLGMAANLDKWGYVFDENCVDKLMTLSEDSIVSIYKQLVSTLQEIKGDDVEHNDFLFKNFPDSCRRVDLDTLSDNRFKSYYAAIIDKYFGTNIHETINWDTETPEERVNARHDNLRTIKLGNEKQFRDMVKNMLSGRMSLSDFDKEIIDFAIENFNAKDIIPEEIPFKENWAYILTKVFDGKLDYDIKFTTITDFIRAAVALSDGDVSLSTKPILRNFKNQERKLLLSKLNEAAKRNPEVFTESLMTQKNRRFVRNVLIKGWHLKPYDKKYHYLCKAINDSELKYSKISLAEQSLAKKDYITAAKYYAQASNGDLIRKANMLITNAPIEQKYEIAGLIAQAADKVAIPVLLNAKNALSIDSPFKVAFIKGNSAKVHAFENKLNIDETSKILLSQIYDNAINKQMSTKKSVGKIYIDKQLKDCPVPFNVRTNNGKNRAVERGTKLPAKEDKNIIRAFCYKKCASGGFYDLSATFLNDKFSMIEQVSWTQLKTSNDDRPMAIHSGDNPRSDIGCTEFIDIDLESVKKYSEKLKKVSPEKDIRYISFQVHAWNGVPFNKMEKVYFGIMQRDLAGSDIVSDEDLKILKENGVNINDLNNHHKPYYYSLNAEQLKLVKDYKQETVFDPDTVDYRYDLTGDGLVKVPMLYDVKENKFIFTDLDAKTPSPFIRVGDLRENESHVKLDDINLYMGDKTPLVENYVGAVAKACYSVVNINKPNLYDLFTQVSKATGAEIVHDRKDADVVCTIDRIDTDQKTITPFDTDEIVSYYLTPDKEDDIIIDISDEQQK